MGIASSLDDMRLWGSIPPAGASAHSQMAPTDTTCQPTGVPQGIAADCFELMETDRVDEVAVMIHIVSADKIILFLQ